MNKSEMADKLAKKADISKAQAADIIDIIFSTKDGEGIIAVELDAGRKVNITGFGSFSLKHRSARQGRNPATGETIMIPARKYAHFSASKGLKDDEIAVTVVDLSDPKNLRSASYRGGEKIYPEEVEKALKHHPSVYDAVVVGKVTEANVAKQPEGRADDAVLHMKELGDNVFYGG